MIYATLLSACGVLQKRHITGSPTGLHRGGHRYDSSKGRIIYRLPHKDLKRTKDSKDTEDLKDSISSTINPSFPVGHPIGHGRSRFWHDAQLPNIAWLLPDRVYARESQRDPNWDEKL